MKTWRNLLGNERGVALPLAMILLVVLTMLTLTFMSLGAVEPQISRNLSDGARARQLAESGIEWGFNQLGGKAFDDATLLGSGLTTGGVNCGSGITCKVLVTGQALPGLTLSLSDGYASQLIQMVKSDEIDFAITALQGPVLMNIRASERKIPA